MDIVQNRMEQFYEMYCDADEKLSALLRQISLKCLHLHYNEQIVNLPQVVADSENTILPCMRSDG